MYEFCENRGNAKFGVKLMAKIGRQKVWWIKQEIFWENVKWDKC